MIKLNKHGMISKRLIAHEFAVGNTVVEGGGTPEELSVLSLTKDQLDALSYIVNGEGRIIPVGEDGTFDTKIGHSYCIRHTDDLTLHEAWLSNDENLYVKRYGSGQLLFFATSEKCKINDPSYIVTEVFRMAALNDFVDWSGISTTQAWFKEIEVELTDLLGSRDKFILEIADVNTLVVHTDRADNTQLEAATALLERVVPQNIDAIRYNHAFDISWRDAEYKYAECTSIADMQAVNPNYMTDLTSDGEWVYALPNMVVVGTPLPAGGAPDGLFRYSSMVTFSGSVPNLESAAAFLRDALNFKNFNAKLPKIKHLMHSFNRTSIEEFDVDISSVLTFHGVFMGSKLKRFKSELPNVTDMSVAFQGAPLEVFECSSDLQNAVNIKWTFDGCLLNKNSALSVLSKKWKEKDIIIGIHIDHQTDDEVLAAIANAEAKGWTLTVQWNGTPTSTASTMAMGSLIYAKIGEHELPDGTTERVLDWGHYVTNPEGYEIFRSLESAYKYFGLEMPEKEEN